MSRQPIFDRGLRVHGYELLCRSEDLSRIGARPSTGSRLLASTLHRVGLDRLTGGRPAFVSFSRELLVEGFALLLSPERVVIQVPAGEGFDGEVLGACERLHSAGYRLAVDCSQGSLPAELLEFASILRVDLAVVPPSRREELVALGPNGCRLLATGVAVTSDFERAATGGFSLFQGLFFQHVPRSPSVDIGRDTTRTLELLELLGQRELDLTRLERVVRADLSLCYRLLRYLNSAAFGWRTHIESVGHALVLLGEDGVRRWLWLSALGELSADRPDELVRTSAVRGWLCESLGTAADADARPVDLFLTGMLSLLDAILRRSMRDVLDEVTVPPVVRGALLDRTGAAGAILRVVEAAEQGDWPGLGSGLEALGLSELAAASCYREALSTADALLGN